MTDIKSLFQLPDEHGTTQFILAVNGTITRIFKSEKGIQEMASDDLGFSRDLTIKVYLLKKGAFI